MDLICNFFLIYYNSRPKVRAQNNFWGGGTWAFFGRGHFTSKNNITFLITNLTLDIFMLNNFFVKSVFPEETAKNHSVGTYLGEPKCNNFWPTLKYKVSDEWLSKCEIWIKLGTSKKKMLNKHVAYFKIEKVNVLSKKIISKCIFYYGNGL